MMGDINIINSLEKQRINSIDRWLYLNKYKHYQDRE